MRLALTGGGTGGHVYPALEVGTFALQNGADVRYFGSVRGIEKAAAERVNIESRVVESGPMPSLMSVGGLKGVVQLLKNSKQVEAQFGQWRPSVLFATGGYSSAPSLRAAAKLKIPIVLHEQNSIPGRSIKFAGRFAAKICIVFESAARYFPTGKTVSTGMPVRAELESVAPSAYKTKDPFTTLISGGSQGARAINDLAVAMIPKIDSAVRWVHISGQNLHASTKKSSEKFSPAYALHAFLNQDEMASTLSRSSLAIVRAGCGTIAELALFGIPAIFVPLPTSFANHQLLNAMEIVAISGGSLIEQKNASTDVLIRSWRAWYDDEDRRAEAFKRLRAWSKPDATQQVFKVIKEVVDEITV